MKVKFRVWAKETNHPQAKVMLPARPDDWGGDQVHITSKGNVIYTEYHSMGGSRTRDITDKCIVMHYIGLNDKAGNEICEGDIIKRGDPIHKVVYGCGTFAFRGITYRSSGYFSHTPSTEFEIIGNIYESPELLTI